MPLQKQKALVPFVGGVQTDQNEFTVQPPNLLRLQNGVFRNEGEISKRYGFSALGKGIFGSTSELTEGKLLDTFDDDLTLFTRTNLYSYSETSDTWFNKGAFAAVEVLKDSIARNRDSQTVPSIATINGVTLAAWEDTRGGGDVRYVVIEDSTGSVVKAETSVGAGATVPQCVVLNRKYLCLLYLQGGSMKSVVINSVNLDDTISNSLVTAVGATEVFDAVPYENYIFMVYNNAGNVTTVAYAQFDDTLGLVQVTGSVDSLNTGSEYVSDAVAAFVDERRKVVYVASVTGNDIRLQGSFQDLSIPTSANVLIETVAGVTNITGIAQSATGDLQIFYEVGAADAINHYVKHTRYSYNGTSTLTQEAAPAIFQRAVGLASHAFEENGTVYLAAGFESPIQATYFILELIGDGESAIAAKALPGIAGGHTTKPSLPRFRTDAQGRRFTSLLEVTRLNTDSGTATDNTGVVRTTLNFQTPPFQSQQIGNSLIIAGGFITAYDGSQVVEHSFHVFPEGVDLGAASGGSLSGVYSYQVIYEWSDAKGQIYRSAPSETLTLDTTSGDTQVTPVAPTLRLTSKQDVKIVLYSTVAGGSVYYRTEAVDNDPTVDTVTFSNINADIPNLNTREILYTTGGVVENIAPPAASLVQTHQNRLFIAGLEEENELRYSKESLQNEGLGFSDFYRIRVNPSGGGITALGTLDDKLIIFKENTIFALSGQGPVETGAQNDFQQPEQISTDVGCNAPSSIVLVKDGLMFQSRDGVKLLNRSLEVVDIGTPVSDFNDLTVSSGVLLPAEDEVRFTTTDGECLVFSTAYNLWSTFTNYEGVSAVLWRGQYAKLSADGTVNLEIVGSYTDNNAAIRLRLETPWLAFGDLLGYKRVYQIMMLGKRLTNHVFRVSMAYDYNDLIRQIAFFNTEAGMEEESFTPSNSSFLPSLSSSYAEGNPVFQFRIKPTIQKCESFKLIIEDIPLNGDLGASYTLTGLSALVGVNPARQLPIPASQTVGD